MKKLKNEIKDFFPSSMGHTLLVLDIIIMVIMILGIYGDNFDFSIPDNLKIVSIILTPITFDAVIIIMLSPFLLSKVLSKSASNLHAKLSNIEFNSNVGYYRELLNQYSLAELSYIDDFNIDIPKDVVVILLNMQSKGIIKLEDNGTIKILDKNKVTKNVENYVIEMIKNDKLNVLDRDIYKYTFEISNDAKNDGLVYKKKSKHSDLKYFLSLIGIIIFAIIYLIERIEARINVNWYIDLIVAYLVMTSIVFLFSYDANQLRRTEKGNEVNNKLEGLKNYLKDFTVLHTRNLEEIKIWEDYLIYSVLFNQNKKVIKEIEREYFIKQ